MPGITACQTLDAQPGTCKQAVSGQRITCIMRTTRGKTTGRRTKWANQILVAMNNFYKDYVHRIATRLKSLLKLSLLMLLSDRSVLRAITTKSMPHAFIWCTRNISLTSRFALFLSTDFGIYLLATTMPSLAFFS